VFRISVIRHIYMAMWRVANGFDNTVVDKTCQSYLTFHAEHKA
jgi:hypothetical protein